MFMVLNKLLIFPVERKICRFGAWSRGVCI